MNAKDSFNAYYEQELERISVNHDLKRAIRQNILHAPASHRLMRLSLVGTAAMGLAAVVMFVMPQLGDSNSLLHTPSFVEKVQAAYGTIADQAGHGFIHHRVIQTSMANGGSLMSVAPDGDITLDLWRDEANHRSSDTMRLADGTIFDHSMTFGSTFYVTPEQFAQDAIVREQIGYVHEPNFTIVAGDEFIDTFSFFVTDEDGTTCVDIAEPLPWQLTEGVRLRRSLDTLAGAGLSDDNAVGVDTQTAIATLESLTTSDYVTDLGESSIEGVGMVHGYRLQYESPIDAEGTRTETTIVEYYFSTQNYTLVRVVSGTDDPRYTVTHTVLLDEYIAPENLDQRVFDPTAQGLVALPVVEEGPTITINGSGCYDQDGNKLSDETSAALMARM